MPEKATITPQGLEMRAKQKGENGGNRENKSHDISDPPVSPSSVRFTLTSLTFPVFLGRFLVRGAPKHVALRVRRCPLAL